MQGQFKRAASMRKSIAVLLVTGLTLSACSSWQGSRANPSNWFGKSKTTETVVVANGEAVNPLLPQDSGSGLFKDSNAPAEDFSVPIASVTELHVEKTPTGAIVYATGLANRQGAYDVHLQQNEDAESTTLDYSFRALYPQNETPVGSDRTRTLQAAVSLTHQDLAGVKIIRVSSESNSRETRR